jgi:pimeloyl-ACP methyl ester carboxylesterase
MADKAKENVESHVLILLHGVRDFGQWQPVLRDALAPDGIKCEAVNYGYFDVLKFLFPFRPFRDATVRNVAQRVREIQSLNPGARFSFLAHSFGSYVIAHMLLEDPTFNAERIILCGSVLSRKFPFARLRASFKAPILNEVGQRDIWPSVAATSTWGYGDIGSTGYGGGYVHDRYHDSDHGGFLTAKFARKFWKPFLLSGEIVPSNFQPRRPNAGVRFLRLFPTKYVVLLALALGVLWGSEGFASPFSTWSGPSDQGCDNRWLAASEYNQCFQALANTHAPRSLEGRRSWFGFGTDEYRADWSPSSGEGCWYTLRSVSQEAVTNKTADLSKHGYVPVSAQSFVNQDGEESVQALWFLKTAIACPSV